MARTGAVAARYAVMREQAATRAGGRCEADICGGCQGHGELTHHVLPVSAGGPDEFDNLLWVCTPCHLWVHANSKASYRLGLLARRRYPPWQGAVVSPQEWQHTLPDLDPVPYAPDAVRRSVWPAGHVPGDPDPY